MMWSEIDKLVSTQVDNRTPLSWDANNATARLKGALDAAEDSVRALRGKSDKEVALAMSLTSYPSRNPHKNKVACASGNKRRDLSIGTW